MKTSKNKSFLTLLLFAASFVFILCSPGCNVKKADTKVPPPQSQDAGTVQKEVIAKISERVLENVPLEGRYREIRKRGVLRVALPPEEPPFQMLDPAFKIPTGFNPALINEISLILEIKPNFEILEYNPGLPDYPPGWEHKYDIIIVNQGAGGCPESHSIKYFYMSEMNGWKTFCVAGEGDALTFAMNSILSYLN